MVPGTPLAKCIFNSAGGNNTEYYTHMHASTGGVREACTLGQHSSTHRKATARQQGHPAHTARPQHAQPRTPSTAVSTPMCCEDTTRERRAAPQGPHRCSTLMWTCLSASAPGDTPTWTHGLYTCLAYSLVTACTLAVGPLDRVGGCVLVLAPCPPRRLYPLNTQYCCVTAHTAILVAHSCCTRTCVSLPRQ